LLKKSYARFDKQNCRFPRQQVGQRGLTKRKHNKKVELLQKRWAKESPEQEMNIKEDQIFYISI